jgi:hypothetical protein
MCNLQKLDYDDLNQAIFEVFQLNSDSAIHLDGKAIRGTIKTHFFSLHNCFFTQQKTAQ